MTGVIAFYGENFSNDVDLFDQVSAPMLLVGATKDQMPTPHVLKAIKEELVAKGKSSSLLVVNAKHGFAERRHPGFSQPAAEKTWAEALRLALLDLTRPNLTTTRT